MLATLPAGMLFMPAASAAAASDTATQTTAPCPTTGGIPFSSQLTNGTVKIGKLAHASGGSSLGRPGMDVSRWPGARTRPGEATKAMSTFDSVAWFPLCAGLTGLGLVGSWMALRRRGAGAGLRGAAWSLLPLAAYLTGAVEMLWRIGTAIADWVGGFVFSPRVWSGVIVAMLAVLLFLLSGALRRRAPGRSAQVKGSGRRAVGAGAAATRAAGERGALERAPAGQSAQRKGKGDADDEFAEVQEILRRRGIS